MASWRRKALALFPELRHQLQRRAYPIASLFICHVGPAVRSALDADDAEALQALFGFAEWCLLRPAPQVSDAARLSFYWHQFDRPADRPVVVRWLSPKAVARCRPMWARVLSAEELAEVEGLLEGRVRARIRKHAEPHAAADRGLISE